MKEPTLLLLSMVEDALIAKELIISVSIVPKNGVMFVVEIGQGHFLKLDFVITRIVHNERVDQ